MRNGLYYEMICIVVNGKFTGGLFCFDKQAVFLLSGWRRFFSKTFTIEGMIGSCMIQPLLVWRFYNILAYILI